MQDLPRSNEGKAVVRFSRVNKLLSLLQWLGCLTRPISVGGGAKASRPCYRVVIGR